MYITRIDQFEGILASAVKEVRSELFWEIMQRIVVPSSRVKNSKMGAKRRYSITIIRCVIS